MGNVAELRRFLNEGAEVQALYADGEQQLSLMMMALEHDHADCITELAKRGADVEEVREKSSLTLLMRAAASHRPACVRALLAAGAKPDVRSALYRQATALMLAAMNGNVHCVRALTEGGASLELQDETGRTALDYAAQFGHTECAEILLQAGATLGLLRAAETAEKNGYGETAAVIRKADVRAGEPLHETAPCNDITEAVKAGRAELVTEFLEKGADPNTHTAEGTLLESAAAHGRAEVLRVLLEAGAETAGKDFMVGPGDLALSKAAKAGHADCMELLLSRGMEAGCCLTPVYAAESNAALCVKLVLQAGVEINRRFCGGRTMLMYAAEKGCADTVQLLLEEGADGDLKDNAGKTAAELAADGGHEACEALLREKKK